MLQDHWRKAGVHSGPAEEEPKTKAIALAGQIEGSLEGFSAKRLKRRNQRRESQLPGPHYVPQRNPTHL